MWLLTAALLVVAAASLCTFVVKLLAPRHPRPTTKIKHVALEWPGNARELGNFIERAVILSRGKRLRCRFQSQANPLIRSQHVRPRLPHRNTLSES